jgi:predicted amidophosphoribosyltransferase
MEEAARVLKKAGAKEIIGIVLARAEPGEDKI